ncbi:MAG: dTMP kinase [Actinobacteria bacterium]|nr:MAG: dTMP kinase [Actinomycetota bacterium]
MFVTFEGVDGSGKSTQAELLRDALAAEGREVVLTREPGGTELGERARELVLNGPTMTPWAEAALFAAARAELVARVILPALGRGADVISDRYVDSSLAYQGIARGIGIEHVLELNLNVVQGLMPDLTVLLLLDPDEAAQRSGATDRLEREGADFRARVDEAYRELAARFPERIVALDGGRPADELAEVIRERLRSRI